LVYVFLFFWVRGLSPKRTAYQGVVYGLFHVVLQGKEYLCPEQIRGDTAVLTTTGFGLKQGSRKYPFHPAYKFRKTEHRQKLKAGVFIACLFPQRALGGVLFL
jgi:hypothetical protein